MQTINPLQSIQFIGTIGSESRGQPQLQVQPQPGQLLKALVLEMQTGGRALLQIGENKVPAKTDVPLKVGETLQLQVTSTSPEMQLKIVGDTLSHFRGKALTLVGKPLDISTLFTSLQQPVKTGGESTQRATPAASPPTTPPPVPASSPAATVSLQTAPPPATPPPTSAALQAGPTQAIASQPQGAPPVSATIETVSSPTRLVITVGELSLPVESSTPIQALPGQQLKVEMVTASPLRLQIVSDTSPPLAGAILTVPTEFQPPPATVTTIFPNLGSIFEILSPQSQHTLQTYYNHQLPPREGHEEGAVLKQLIDRLGLSFEHQLARGENSKAAATLKAALMEILSTFKGADQIARSTSQLLTTLEMFQLAQLQSDTGQQFIFPLPLPFLEQGYLLVDRNKSDEGGEGQEGESDRRFSLHLKMSDIGNIRVDFLQSTEGLFIRFHTDASDKAEFVKGFSDELRQAISETPLIGLSFGTDAGDPAAELMRHILPEGTTVLDTRA